MHFIVLVFLGRRRHTVKCCFTSASQPSLPVPDQRPVKSISVVRSLKCGMKNWLDISPTFPLIFTGVSPKFVDFRQQSRLKRSGFETENRPTSEIYDMHLISFA